MHSVESQTCGFAKRTVPRQAPDNAGRVEKTFEQVSKLLLGNAVVLGEQRVVIGGKKG